MSLCSWMTGPQEMIHDNGFCDSYHDGKAPQSADKWYLLGYHFGIDCLQRDARLKPRSERNESEEHREAAD